MKNRDIVKYLFSKWGFKMCELIENSKNLRKFLYYVITVLFIVYPVISIVSNVINYILHQG